MLMLSQLIVVASAVEAVTFVSCCGQCCHNIHYAAVACGDVGVVADVVIVNFVDDDVVHAAAVISVRLVIDIFRVATVSCTIVATASTCFSSPGRL